MKGKFSFLMVVFLLAARVDAAPEESSLETFQSALDEIITFSQRDSGKKLDSVDIERLSALVNVLVDQGMVLAQRSSTDDLPIIMEACRGASEASTLLLMRGLEDRISSSENVSDETLDSVQLMMKENALNYSVVLEPLMVFSLRCNSYTIPVLEEFVRLLPSHEVTKVRMEGLSMFRNGIFNMIVGSLNVIADEEISTEHRLETASTLDEVAAEFSSAMTIPLRQRAEELVRSAREGSVPPFREYLVRIEEALKDRGCNALCATSP
ncbi:MULTISPECIES: hypothetical protein [unclassified Halomonas]|uniref:hypothetical protein n=1 Tax=unclassified Halomonas TaxID=2609666 RepID=UPI001C947F1D|nr:MULTISPECIES: hypothetical protein [unclassified Halomonas]MBY5927405.1 hypothetical protein [Halomonas sp. DP4Y7-2]MBY6234446.1 hypothetical protein [Halomonas sp. DP4Y7-1]